MAAGPLTHDTGLQTGQGVGLLHGNDDVRSVGWREAVEATETGSRQQAARNCAVARQEKSRKTKGQLYSDSRDLGAWGHGGKQGRAIQKKNCTKPNRVASKGWANNARPAIRTIQGRATNAGAKASTTQQQDGPDFDTSIKNRVGDVTMTSKRVDE